MMKNMVRTTKMPARQASRRERRNASSEVAVSWLEGGNGSRGAGWVASAFRPNRFAMAALVIRMRGGPDAPAEERR
jgi:hypothetical protein